jgi:beta-glucosidase
VRNTGNRAGAEVVQLYVHDGDAKIDRPVHELKGFSRVELKPGEAKTVRFTLDRTALSYWDPAKRRGPPILEDFRLKSELLRVTSG